MSREQLIRSVQQHFDAGTFAADLARRVADPLTAVVFALAAGALGNRVRMKYILFWMYAAHQNLTMHIYRAHIPYRCLQMKSVRLLALPINSKVANRL